MLISKRTISCLIETLICQTIINKNHWTIITWIRTDTYKIFLCYNIWGHSTLSLSRYSGVSEYWFPFSQKELFNVLEPIILSFQEEITSIWPLKEVILQCWSYIWLVNIDIPSSSLPRIFFFFYMWRFNMNDDYLLVHLYHTFAVVVWFYFFSKEGIIDTLSILK